MIFTLFLKLRLYFLIQVAKNDICPHFLCTTQEKYEESLRILETPSEHLYMLFDNFRGFFKKKLPGNYSWMLSSVTQRHKLALAIWHTCRKRYCFTTLCLL